MHAPLIRIAVAAAITGLFALPAAAEDGRFIVRVGAHVVAPKSSNGSLAGGAFQSKVGRDIKPTISGELMLSPNFGIEVLAALPFRHDVTLKGANGVAVKAATVKHLPPVVSAQWHFMPDGKVSPFVGVGLNFTRFFGVRETGPLTGTHLNLGDSWGLALHGGVDFRIDDRWLITADVRWANIDTKATLNGASIGTVHIDPLVYGASFGYRF